MWVAELPSGTVTFLFTDIEGSTRLWEEHPDAMRDALARHDEILRDAVQSHGGHVVKNLGDGVFAVFAAAHDGVAAAVDGQRALEAEPWGEVVRLRVRAGLHTAEAQHRDGDYYGPALNRTARLMAAAHGGQVVVSHATKVSPPTRCPKVSSLWTWVSIGCATCLVPNTSSRSGRWAAVGSFPPLRSLDAFPGNLPVQLTSFVGRDDDVAGVAKALDESRLVTLTGVGGVGKTRLAIQVAAELLPRFTDGVWLCELAATNDPDLLAQVMVAALGVQPRAGRSLAESVVRLPLREAGVDRARQLRASPRRGGGDGRGDAAGRAGGTRAGDQPGGPRRGGRASVACAITACRVRGESGGDRGVRGGAALRRLAAGAVQPSFALDESNATAVVEICRRLDGIPLAVELAAARVTSMLPGEIAGLLDDRFRLLTGGRRRGVERHHTLRATIEWSYSLLDERERVVFDRLGVFAESFDADAATNVAGSDELAAWDVRDALDDLAAKSMIVLEDGPQATRRFRLLETLRQYALERLDDSGDAEDYRRRHAEHYATFAEAAGPGLEGSDEAAWVGRVRRRTRQPPRRGRLGPRHRSTSRRRAGSADHRPARRPVLLSPVGRRGRMGRSRPDARGNLDTRSALRSAYCRGLESAPRRRPRPRAARVRPRRCATGFPLTRPPRDGRIARLAGADSFSGDHPAAQQTLAAGRRALDAIGAPDYAHLELDLNGLMGRSVAGQIEEARAPAEDALRRARTLANPSQLIVALRWYAGTRRDNETDETIQALEECLAHSRAVATPDAPDVLQPLGLLAKLRARRHERGPAIEALRQGVVRAHDSGQLVMLAFVLSCGVNVAVDLDAPELAAMLGGAITDGSLADLVRADRRAALDHAQAQLGPDRYDAAHATGFAMSYDRIVEYTLAELDRLLAENKQLTGT